MLLSIIIPHYNTPEGLESLLETIPQHDQIEIIVVDDNSEYPPYENKQLLMKDVKYVKNNLKGAGSARNLGIKISKGDWLLFADSDDKFTNNAFNIALREVARALEDIIYFPPTSFNSKVKGIGSRHEHYELLVDEYLKNNCLLNESKLRAHFFVPWSKLIRKSLVENKKIEFDDIMYSNDLLFSAKTGIFSSKIKAVDECLYIVTESPTSLTKNYSRIAFDVRLDAAIRYNTFLCENGYKRFTMPLLKYLLWSRKFGINCFLTTLKKSLTGNNRLINKNWIYKYLSINFLLIKIKELVK